MENFKGADGEDPEADTCGSDCTDRMYDNYTTAALLAYSYRTVVIIFLWR